MRGLRALERLVETARRESPASRAAGLEPLREQVAEQHHALRMAVGEDGELAQRFAGVEPLGLEAAGEVGEHLLERQRPERQRIGLAEQRPLAGVEELAHHRRLRPGVDVGGGVAVVLDARAQQAVEVLSRATSRSWNSSKTTSVEVCVALPQRLRQVEQPVA